MSMLLPNMQPRRDQQKPHVGRNFPCRAQFAVEDPEKQRLRLLYAKELDALTPAQRFFREEELGIRKIRRPEVCTYGGFITIKTPFWDSYVLPCFLRQRYPGYVEEIEEIEGSFDRKRNMPPVRPKDRDKNVIYPQPYCGPRKVEHNTDTQCEQKIVEHFEKKVEEAPTEEKKVEMTLTVQIAEAEDSFDRKRNMPPVRPKDRDKNVIYPQPYCGPHKVGPDMNEKHEQHKINQPEPFGPRQEPRERSVVVDQRRLRLQHAKELDALTPAQRFFREEELGIRKIRRPEVCTYGGFITIKTPFWDSYVLPCFLRQRYPGYVEEIEEIEGSFDRKRNMPPVRPKDRDKNVIYPQPYCGPRKAKL